MYQETSYKIKVVLIIRNERNCDEVEIEHCMSEYQKFQENRLWLSSHIQLFKLTTHIKWRELMKVNSNINHHSRRQKTEDTSSDAFARLTSM